MSIELPAIVIRRLATSAAQSIALDIARGAPTLDVLQSIDTLRETVAKLSGPVPDKAKEAPPAALEPEPSPAPPPKRGRRARRAKAGA